MSDGLPNDLGIVNSFFPKLSREGQMLINGIIEHWLDTSKTAARVIGQLGHERWRAKGGVLNLLATGRMRIERSQGPVTKETRFRLVLTASGEEFGEGLSGNNPDSAILDEEGQS